MAAGKPSALDERRAEFARYKDDVKKRGKPFYPFAMFEDTVMSVFVVSVIIALATIWKWTSWAPHHDGTHQGLLGPEYTAPADPGTTSFVPRPDWYFYFLFYLLRIFKWPNSVFLGTVGVPTIALILLIALPFYDLRRERHPLRRPLAMVGAVLVIFSMAIAGCTACHTYLGAGGSQLGAPDLTAIGTRKLGIDFQIRHLKCPSCVNPGSPMPKFASLGDKRLRQLAIFLENSKGPG